MSIAMVMKAKEAIFHHYITTCLLAVVVTHARQEINLNVIDKTRSSHEAIYYEKKTVKTTALLNKLYVQIERLM